MPDSEYIDSYFKKELTAKQITQFEQRIMNDETFAEDVAFYCSTLHISKDILAREKKKRFREIFEEKAGHKENKTPVIFMRRWWSKVAVAAAFVAASMVWWLQPTAMELADKYIKDNFSEIHVTMGNNDSMQIAADLYKEGKWTESLSIFERLAETDSTNTTTIKNAGIVSFRLMKYDKALSYFIKLENKHGRYNPGKLYHALTLVKRNHPGDQQMAKQLLLQITDQDPDEKEFAATLLKKL